MQRSVILLTAFALAGTAASSAQAAVRSVAPAGTGTACTSGAPCDVIVGIGSAVPGDEVRIAPGSYTVPVRVDAPSDIAIRGTGSAADTVITMSVSGSGNPGLGLGRRNVLSDVTIRRTGGPGTIGVFMSESSRAERTVVECPSPCGEAVRFNTGGRIALDSVLAWAQNGVAIRASGPGATFDATLSATLQNVTAVSDSTAALEVSSSASRPAAVELSDSIIVGTGASDVQMHQNSQTVSAAELLARNSFLRPTITRLDGFGFYTDLGGNSASAPTFVNRATHDLRPAAGSPTIDSDPVLTAPHALDLARHARLAGSALDAGAYEFTPEATPTPTPSPTPATPTPTPAPAAVPTPAIVTVSGVSVKSGKVQFTLSAPGVVRVQVLRGKAVKRTLWLTGKAGINRVKLPKLPKGSYSVQVAASGVLGTASKIAYRQR